MHQSVLLTKQHYRNTSHTSKFNRFSFSVSFKCNSPRRAFQFANIMSVRALAPSSLYVSMCRECELICFASFHIHLMSNCCCNNSAWMTSNVSLKFLFLLWRAKESKWPNIEQIMIMKKKTNNELFRAHMLQHKTMKIVYAWYVSVCVRVYVCHTLKNDALVVRVCKQITNIKK